MQNDISLMRMIKETRQIMTRNGWDRFDLNRETPSLEMVCFVAIRALSRCEMSGLSTKAATQISLLIKYLMAFDARRKAPKKDLSVIEQDELNASFCASSLFTCASILSTGGVWRGVDEDMFDGLESGDSALDEWVEDSYYFYEMASDVGISDIVLAHGRGIS